MGNVLQCVLIAFLAIANETITDFLKIGFELTFSKFLRKSFSKLIFIIWIYIAIYFSELKATFYRSNRKSEMHAALCDVIFPVELSPEVNFANILWAAFLSISFCPKITHTNWNYKKQCKTISYKKSCS